MQEAELPLESVGAKLARAREAAGMSRTQLAAATRIPERHIASIEAGNFAALPARTYAIGFTRSCAKVLGLDDNAIIEEVRSELDAQEPEPLRRAAPAFEPGDPARVPGRRLVWVALLALIGLIALFAFTWRSLYSPGGALPSLLPEDKPQPQVSAPAAPPPAATPGGPVVFTALAPDIWVKFYDGAGNQLLQKQLAQGESWTVPADQQQVLLWTGRPEALAITIGGQSVPKLSDVQRTMKDVPVTAAALLARGTAQPVASEAPAVSVSGQGQPQPRRRPQGSAAPASSVSTGAGATAPAEPAIAVSTPAPAAT
jgi:transcriptional regulator with XRE-family HTH domain